MKPIMNTFKLPPLPLATLSTLTLALLCAFTLSACGPADKPMPVAETPATDPL